MTGRDRDRKIDADKIKKIELEIRIIKIEIDAQAWPNAPFYIWSKSQLLYPDLPDFLAWSWGSYQSKDKCTLHKREAARTPVESRSPCAQTILAVRLIIDVLEIPLQVGGGPIGWMFSRLNQRSDTAGGANGILKALVTGTNRCVFWEFQQPRKKRGSTNIHILLSNLSHSIYTYVYVYIHIYICI